MKNFKSLLKLLIPIFIASMIVLVFFYLVFDSKGIFFSSKKNPWDNVVQNKKKPLDHSKFYKEMSQSSTPQEITQSCLKCHNEVANDLMKTAHWKWLGDEITVKKSNVVNPGETITIGKKNLLNNFCLSINGNFASCTKCHAGYGWSDNKFDFNNPQNVDCLVCHDQSGSYTKGPAGNPPKDMNLVEIAKKVGPPKKENCGSCHFYGGGGLGVKHGDLDTSLLNPNEDLDVHMGKVGLSCTDCHKTSHHEIPGKAYSVSVNTKHNVSCTDCHGEKLHDDERINLHTKTIACQTCHIPTYAKKVPTKMFWDWSKAGDDKRASDPHHYLKIKGEFKYEQNLTPEYFWFNGNVERYIIGDTIDPKVVTDLNMPLGNITDPTAKIWPFKLHIATQPYDKVHNILLPPITSGEGGYWHDFNWTKALELGAKEAGLPFSGKHGFHKTNMYWPLSHMVAPKQKALRCTDCHGDSNRFDWEKMGYIGDPIQVGGRTTSKEKGEK